MTTAVISSEADVDHFLILTYENQLIFIVLDKEQAKASWEE